MTWVMQLRVSAGINVLESYLSTSTCLGLHWTHYASNGNQSFLSSSQDSYNQQQQFVWRSVNPSSRKPLPLPHIHTSMPRLGKLLKTSSQRPQVTTPDNQTRTHAWPTNFYSLYLIWLQNQGEEGRPPWLLSQCVEFLLFPPPLPGLLYLHMPGSGTNQRAAWDALNWGRRHFITEALSSPAWR